MGELPTGDEAIAAWVSQEVARLDQTRRDPRWRTRAVGAPLSAVIAEVPSEYRLDVKVPLAEMRVVNAVAARRGLATRTYLRRALVTVMVACDGVAPEEMGVTGRGGLIAPWT